MTLYFTEQEFSQRQNAVRRSLVTGEVYGENSTLSFFRVDLQKEFDKKVKVCRKIKKRMKKLKMHSPDLTDGNIARIRDLTLDVKSI